MQGQEYPKIETLFSRDPQTFVVDTTRVKFEEVEQIKHWLVTEKIDGTNIRVSLECDGDDDDYVVRFGGRTNAAAIPMNLLNHLIETFPIEKMQKLWLPDARTGELRRYPITLYGEGYGAGIQKDGGVYNPKASFRLFDVRAAGTWLNWENVAAVAARLDIFTVPLLDDMMPFNNVIKLVQAGVQSTVALVEGDASPAQARERWEGVVARTDPYLYDQHQRPLKFKLKVKDFVAGKR